MKEKKVSDTNKVQASKKEKGTPASTDERDHEILQLDNLFLTVREQLVSKVTESKKHKTHKKSKKNSKHLKKKSNKQGKKKSGKEKAPESFSLLQLEANLGTSAE